MPQKKDKKKDKSKDITRRVDPVAKDLRTPKYKQRIVEDKTRYKRGKNKDYMQEELEAEEEKD